MPSTVGTLVLTFSVAIVLNYLWELGQAPLHVGLERYDPAVFWHCFVASVGDGVMVVLIIAVGRISFHRWDWFQRPGLTGYLIMLTTGLVLAVLVEWTGVHILDRWEYTENMPAVPWVRIGLVPIAQMIVLPPAIFRIAALCDSKR